MVVACTNLPPVGCLSLSLVVWPASRTWPEIRVPLRGGGRAPARLSRRPRAGSPQAVVSLTLPWPAVGARGLRPLIEVTLAPRVLAPSVLRGRSGLGQRLVRRVFLTIRRSFGNRVAVKIAGLVSRLGITTSGNA